MKILLHIPSHLRTVPMNGYSADALRALGHTVEVFNGRGGTLCALADTVADKFPGDKKRLANFLLKQKIKAFRPDLFLAIFGFDVAPATLHWLRGRNIKTACWWLNDPFQFARSAKKAHLYDFFFTNAAGSVADYARLGVRAWHLPTACVPALHRKTAVNLAYESEVCFAGDWSELREELMLKVLPVCRLKIFGPWSKKLSKDSPLRKVLVNGFFSPAQMAEMFSSAKIVLNIHTWFRTATHGTNPRLFEAAGCGAAQLVDFKEEIPSLFEPGREILIYRELDEVPAILKAALADPLRLEAIGLAARQRAYGEHTYEHRMKKLMSCVGAN